MEICTIGFSKKTARTFFESLKLYGIRQLIDVRLNNVSQLAGFTKKEDREYFLREICDCAYLHLPVLAPTRELLAGYRQKTLSWETYEKSFRDLLCAGAVEHKLDRSLFEVPVALLCSEAEATFCHRRLVAEYLQERWPDVTVRHL